MQSKSDNPDKVGIIFNNTKEILREENETKFTALEEKAADALEMAKKTHEEGKEKTTGEINAG